MANRRGFIALIGGGVVVAAGAAIGLTAFPVGLPDAAASWRNPGAGETDIRRKALSYAILAPNPHNMQPWRADLREPNTITLSLDRTRLLPQTDPYSRQIIIGCGAFLEQLDLAARHFGAQLTITPWPEGEPGPILDDRPFARVTLTPAPAQTDPLFAQILARRTNRQAYDAARIPAAADLAAIAAQGTVDGRVRAAFDIDPARVAKMRDLVWRGYKREMTTPAKLKESVDVMHIGDREISRHREGLAIGGPVMNLMAATGLITREALLDPNSDVSKQGFDMWKPLVDTAPGFVWQVSADNTRTTQLAVGRAYARLNLEATARGLSIHPWSMALQEYPEIADLYAEQQAMLGGTAAAPVQMLVRIGYAAAIPPSPRRDLSSFLKT